MVLLIQDDCAPDSLQSFENQLLIKFGLTMDEFFQRGQKIEFGYSMDGYKLERFPEDPYWQLSDLT